MRLVSARIRNFRSIEDITVELGELAVLVGPNSSGKSNIFRAIMFPFQDAISQSDIYENLSSWRRDTQGGPLLSIYVDLYFSGDGVSDFLQELLPGQTVTNGEVKVAFRAIRSGTVTYHCNSQQLGTDAEERLRSLVRPVFVPSIRDLDHGGLGPFQKVLADALRRARGETITKKQHEVRNILTSRAGGLLYETERELQRHVPGLKLLPDANGVSLEDVYKLVHLTASTPGTGDLNVSALGTGHQSVLIMALHKALADSGAALTVFLIDEPASHLHPAALEVLRDELGSLSESAQVLAATHSPGLVSRIGLERCVRVDRSPEGKTECEALGQRLSPADGQIAHVLFHHQMRALEPLFSREVIVVEGRFDATVVRKTSQLLGYGLPESMNVPIVAAGGKGAMPGLLAALKKCGSRRLYVLLDRDAVSGGGPPALSPRRRSAADEASLNAALSAVRGELGTGKRAQGILRGLEALEAELADPSSTQTIYDSSALSRVVDELGILRVQEKQELARELQAGRKRRPKQLLGSCGIYLLRSTADRDLLTKTGAEDVVARECGRTLPGQSRQEDKRLAAAALKSLSSDPEKLCSVLEALHTASLLATSEMGKAVRWLVGSLGS